MRPEPIVLLFRSVLVVILAAVGIAGSTVGAPPPRYISPHGTQYYIYETHTVSQKPVVDVRPETHQSGEVTYHYRIVNRRPSPLAEITIGLVPSLDEPELRVAPIDWVPGTNDCPTSMKAPQGWTACVGRQEESDRHFLTFAAKSDSAFLCRGPELTFAVTVARPDSAYRTARYLALFTELPPDEGLVKEVDAVE